MAGYLITSDKKTNSPKSTNEIYSKKVGVILFFKYLYLSFNNSRKNIFAKMLGLNRRELEMEPKPKYVTCLNCIDGRAQLPVIQWIKSNYLVDFIDMITEPGMDGVLADENSNLDEILRKVNVSLEAHKTNKIFIVGHYGCAANQVDLKTHKVHIKRSVQRMKKIKPKCEVIGLWVENQELVELVIKK
ncbi:hypothetical protein GCM10025860_07670 [Methanobacterium ferruginis]|nr:hypothetical protein GCM10025860_07670 [Methanobacterium ferruginis]